MRILERESLQRLKSLTIIPCVESVKPNKYDEYSWRIGELAKRVVEAGGNLSGRGGLIIG